MRGARLERPRGGAPFAQLTDRVEWPSSSLTSNRSSTASAVRWNGSSDRGSSATAALGAALGVRALRGAGDAALRLGVARRFLADGAGLLARDRPTLRDARRLDGVAPGEAFLFELLLRAVGMALRDTDPTREEDPRAAVKCAVTTRAGFKISI